MKKVGGVVNQLNCAVIESKAPMGSTSALKVRWLSELFHIEVGELGFLFVCINQSLAPGVPL